MKALSVTELLSIWERGTALLPVDRALIMVAAALPEKSEAALAEISIGQRDSHLLTLRETIFGREMICLIACPECNEFVEMDFKVSDIRAQAGTKQKEYEVLSVERGGYEARFRLPNSSDLNAIVGSQDIGNKELTMTRSRLLMRCILSASLNGNKITADQLPQDVLDFVVDEMARADPQADIQLTLICPSCSCKWQAVFDIVSFLWSEIDAWAHRTLRDVHVLASAYGWSESDILALSSWRRQLYLDMVAE